MNEVLQKKKKTNEKMNEKVWRSTEKERNMSDFPSSTDI